MTELDLYKDNPEPVPPASQLAVLPFLAAVDGYLREDEDVPGLRITVHRTMSRERRGYLQQVCAYLKKDGGDWRGRVGRTFPVDYGIIGASYGSRSIWRTKGFKSEAQFNDALKADNIDPGTVRKAWLAMPFLGPTGEVVLILFADCDQLNFFADDQRVKRVAAMGRGFCRLFDWLQRDPFEHLRNFPLAVGEPVEGARGAYNVQEALSNVESPRFSALLSFNYEASAA